MQLHVSALCVGHHQVPHVMYSHLSSVDNLMTPTHRAETCSCILYIATNYI